MIETKEHTLLTVTGTLLSAHSEAAFLDGRLRHKK